MKAFHKQASYTRENLQNAENIDLYKETIGGENPGTYRKWVFARLKADQIPIFEQARKKLNEKQLFHVSDNHIMRYLAARDFNLDATVLQIVEAEEVRLSLNGWNLNQNEF